MMATGLRRVFLGLLMCAAFFAASGTAAAARPDLVVSSLSVTGSLTPGATVKATFTTRNRGTVGAGSSTTRLLASVDRRNSADDLALGQVSIPTLAPGASVTKTLSVKVPSGSRRGELLACADAASVVAEADELNNCRVAPDADGDGWADFSDCAPSDALVNPGAPDAPDVPRFADTNCDGIDGDARRGIFVAPTGVDSNPGTRAQPKHTLGAALPAAYAAAKNVYLAAGTYAETLVVANGVSVFGGYGASWARSLTSKTRIVGAGGFGDSTAAFAMNIPTRTTLQLVTLAPVVPTTAGADSYGLRGANSPSLRLDHITVRAGAGVRGADGPNGATGQPGGDGHAGDESGAWSLGGFSPVGRTGGKGGVGGFCHATTGADGDQGLSTTPDEFGLVGGPGGGGGSEGNIGGAGYAGDSGRFLGNGTGGTSSNTTPGSPAWTTAPGTNGWAGSNGHGGGGGGGGGGEGAIFCGISGNDGGNGGGGGGGGQGGGGGYGGQGGGGSFGIFLVGSTGAIVRASSVTADAGGAGGTGGGGDWGGAGGAAGAGGAPSGGDAAWGGRGGLGGVGGRGGDGGGGAGGPSIAIYGLTSDAARSTTVAHGSGGAGGAGGVGTGFGAPGGADGIVADFLQP